MYKRYQAKHYNGKVKMNIFSKMTTVIILLILLAFNSMSGVLSYFTSTVSATNHITLAPMYTIHYDANGGTGTMADQSIIMGVSANLTTNSYTKTGSVFNGWNTAANGSGTSYTDGQSVTDVTNVDGGTVTLYAQWEQIVQVKYAVQIYGINQDEDANGNTLGLTFGPATRDNYNNKYVTHEYEAIPNDPNGNYYVKIITHTVAADNTETTTSAYLTDSSSNNVTRTTVQVTARQNINLHTMTWAQIAAVSDKTLFEDCMLCGDTKSVTLTLNNTIKNASFTTSTSTGDGAGLLYNCIKEDYRKWNNTNNNDRDDKAYAGSRIRATLIGNNNDTKAAYAGTGLLNSSTCLYSCIETDLKNLIIAKKVKYVTGTSTSNYTSNNDITDKIWLLSEIELNGRAPESGGTGTEGIAYQKFTNSESSATSRDGYIESGSGSNGWWLRSPDLGSTNGVRIVFPGGDINSEITSNNHAIGFGFCIGITIPSQTYEIEFDANGGTGLMSNQEMTIGTSANLTANSYTRTGYTFAGWNTQADGNGTSYTDGQSVTDLTNTVGATVTLYAQWQPETYNITYTLNDGTVATSNPTTYNIETATFTLNNPTKTGYNFTGWSGTDLTGSTNTTVTITQGSTGDRTYTANFTPITYYIRFNANGGTGTMNNQEMTYGTAATLTPNDFQKNDYSFTEWNTEPDGTGTSYQDEESINNLTTIDGAIIDLYAQWEDELYVAQIDNKKYETLSAAVAAVQANGPQKTIKLLKNIDINSSITVANGKNIILNLQNHTINNIAASNTSISSFENNGTLEIKNGTLQSGAKASVLNNNATGHLKIDNVTVTATGLRQAVYNNGGTVEITGNSQLSATTTERATVHNVKPNNGSAGTITISGGTILSPNATEKAAVENENTGTVIVTGGTIISTNGNGIQNNGTLIIGTDEGEVHTDSPVIQGYINGVTTTDAVTLEFYDGIVKGGTSAFNNDNYIDTIDSRSTLEHSTEQIDGDTYDTAYLDAPAKVKFEGEGGTPEFEYVYVEPGNQIGTLPTATRARYSLDGWFTAAEGGTQITSSTIINEHTTYYAHWTQTEALVKFEAHGGTPAEQTMTVTIGTQLGSLPTATKHDSVLLGWFTAPDETGTQISTSTVITADTTFYAHWDLETVEVTFNANGGNVTETEREIISGAQVGPLPVPTRSGYGFAGWYTDPTNGTRVTEDTIITEDTPIYAHWILNPAASIGQLHYETLLEAIRDVPTDNTQTTIVLLKDTLEAVDVVENQNILINLDGYTLYNDGSKTSQNATAGSRPSTIENYGTLALVNGTVTSSSTQSTINNNGGTLNIENVTVTQTGNASKQAIYNDGGTVTISGNSYISAKNSGKFGGADRGAIQNISSATKTGTLIITGGTIVSTTSHAIVNQGNSVLILGEEDGSIDETTPVIQGKTYGVQNMTNGTFNFYDGTVKGKTNSISGTVSDAEDNGTRTDTTETIGSDTYHITYYE